MCPVKDSIVAKPWPWRAQNDASVIEAMWLQDEDLGITKESMQSFFENDDIEVLKKQQFLESQEKQKEEEEKKTAEKPDDDDPWFGLDFTIDSETGEPTLIPTKGASKTEDVSFPLPLDIDVQDFSLDQALGLVDGFKDNNETEDIPETVLEISSSASSNNLSSSVSSTHLSTSLPQNSSLVVASTSQPRTVSWSEPTPNPNFVLGTSVPSDSNTSPDNPGRKPPDPTTSGQQRPIPSQTPFFGNQTRVADSVSTLSTGTSAVSSHLIGGANPSPPRVSPHRSPLSQIVPSANSSPSDSTASFFSEDNPVSHIPGDLSSSDEISIKNEDEATDWLVDQLRSLSSTNETSSIKSEDGKSNNNETQEELGKQLDEMIQAAQLHHPHHPRHFQGRMPLMPSMGPVMEQRWGELSGLLGPSAASPDTMSSSPYHGSNPHQVASPYSPYPAYPHTHPMSELNVHYPTTPGHPMVGGIGSAVATSMSLNNASDPNVEAMTQHHDSAMYYQGAAAAAASGPSEVNQGGNDHIMNTIIDEDLHFVDMAVNEGMYNMRMLDGGEDAARATGGRADWGTPAPSEAGATPFTAIDYTNSAAKYRGFTGFTSPAGDTERRCMPTPPQKKHQLFGRHRGYPDPSALNSTNYTTAGAVAAVHPGIKLEYPSPQLANYSHLEAAAQMESCGFDYPRHPGDLSQLDPLRHNHSYALGPDSAMQPPRSHARDKQKGRKEESHTCRDEKRARSMGIPMSAEEIVNLPMDEFNEKLSRYDLTEPQLSLIRDIRRRGKNKVAAQNCRKRKLDQILCLADEVKDIRSKRERMEHQMAMCTQAYAVINDKFTRLYRHVFQALRDPDGNPYSSYDWSLQQSADGSILLVPRNATNTATSQQPPDNHQHEGRPKYRDPQD